MKKKLTFFLIALLSLTTICACSGESSHKKCIDEIAKQLQTDYYSYSVTKLKGHECYIIDFYDWNIPQSHTVWSDCHQNGQHQLIRIETVYYS